MIRNRKLKGEGNALHREKKNRHKYVKTKSQKENNGIKDISNVEDSTCIKPLVHGNSRKIVKKKKINKSC